MSPPFRSDGYHGLVRYRSAPAPASRSVMWVAWGDGSARIVPDGHADLVWSGRRLLIAGYDTTPQWVDRAAAPLSLGVRLRPGQLPVLARLPASELVDQRIPLHEILGVSRAEQLEGRMICAADPGAELDELAAQLLGHIESTTVAEASVIHDRLASGVTVASVAAGLGWSERRLHRFCVERYGFGPKLLQQILRFHRAYELLGSGAPIAATATRCGFSDQAHLHRAVRRFGDTTPGSHGPHVHQHETRSRPPS